MHTHSPPSSGSIPVRYRRILILTVMVVSATACHPDPPPEEPLTWEDRYVDAAPDLDASMEDIASTVDPQPDLTTDTDLMDMASGPDLDQSSIEDEEMDQREDLDMGGSGTGYLYVSGGNNGDRGFIARIAYDSARKRLTREADIRAGNMLTYLAYSPRHDLLYAPDEAKLELHVFDVASEDGSLSMHATSPTGCHGVHVMLDPAQEHIVMACYREGETELFHHPDRDTISSTHRVESGARTHQACMTPREDRLFVVSLQRQQLMRYHLDAGNHRLEALEPPAITIPGNIGPRHMVMHPTQPLAYVLGELQPSVHVARWDEATGSLSTGRGVSLLENDATRQTTGAAIRLHPSGRWLLSTQRFLDGRDGRLVVLALDESGEPQGEPRFFSTLGEKPRDFHISPDGNLVAVANRNSRAVAIFGFDAQTGELTYLRSEQMPGEPLSVLFVER